MSTWLRERRAFHDKGDEKVGSRLLVMDQSLALLLLVLVVLM